LRRENVWVSVGGRRKVLEIGSSLREARRRRQLGLADVEAATRIRTQQLEALERERFELLPPDPYRRSFLRETAISSGSMATSTCTSTTFASEPPEPTPLTPPSRRRLELGRLLGPRPLFLVGSVVAAIFGVSVWLLGGSGGTATATSIAATHARTRPSPHTHRHAAPERAPGLAARALVLTGVRGSCWLWVRIGSTSGPTVYEQTLQAGQTVRFGLRRPLWIRLGAPWNKHRRGDRPTLAQPRASRPDRRRSCHNRRLAGGSLRDEPAARRSYPHERRCMSDHASAPSTDASSRR